MTEENMTMKFVKTKKENDKKVFKSLVLLIFFVIGISGYKYLKVDINNITYHNQYNNKESLSDELWKMTNNPNIYIIILGLIGFYFIKKYNSKWEIENVYVYSEKEKIKNCEDHRDKATEIDKLERFANAYLKNNDDFNKKIK